MQTIGRIRLSRCPGLGLRLGVVAAVFRLLARIGRLVEAFLVSLSTRAATSWDDVLLPLAGKAVRRALPLLALILARRRCPSRRHWPNGPNATSLLLIALVAFILLFEIVDAAASFVLRQHRMDVSDNLQARAIYTQVVVLKKVAVTVIGIFTLASMLMVFDSVRQFGASILASAGIAGIVVGFAAQRSIATLLAGFQIALTQPIRVDDVVIVEGEWGRIEDITLTYVVVRIWDLRRLVVPITYFIEQPFQNWTRSSADVLGTVFLYVDYTVPLDALRAELTRILEHRVLGRQGQRAAGHRREGAHARGSRARERRRRVAGVGPALRSPREAGRVCAAELSGEPAAAADLAAPDGARGDRYRRVVAVSSSRGPGTGRSWRDARCSRSRGHRAWSPASRGPCSSGPPGRPAGTPPTVDGAR